MNALRSTVMTCGIPGHGTMVLKVYSTRTSMKQRPPGTLTGHEVGIGPAVLPVYLVLERGGGDMQGDEPAAGGDATQRVSVNGFMVGTPGVPPSSLTIVFQSVMVAALQAAALG